MRTFGTVVLSLCAVFVVSQNVAAQEAENGDNVEQAGEHSQPPKPDFGVAEWPQALKMADFILSTQQPSGAIPDLPGAVQVNQDSNMEYALIGLGAAYSARHQAKYLTGLENGIEWLAAREVMNDPMWRGSWFYVYSATAPFAPIPSSPGPGITDVRGVDATSALFVYLLYLDQRLSGNNLLVNTYATNATAALDFVVNHNIDADGFSWSSWQKFASDGQWHLYKFKYSADQGDVYLGMQAGALLYNSHLYGPVAQTLRTQTPLHFFSSANHRYGLGIDEFGTLDTSLDGFSEGFAQGYLSWMWGNTSQNMAARAWLASKVKKNGSIVTKTGSPAYSLSVAMLGMADKSLGQPEPLSSFRWLIGNTYDSTTGGVGDSFADRTTQYVNVTSFCEISLLEVPAF